MARKANVVAVPKNGYRVRRESVLAELAPKPPTHSQYVNENAVLPSNICVFVSPGFYSVANRTWHFITASISRDKDGRSAQAVLLGLCNEAALDTERIRYLKLTDARELCGLVTIA